MTLRPQYIISLLVIALLVLGGYAILSAAPARQGPVVPTRKPTQTPAAPEATNTPTDIPSATATELPTETPTPTTPIAQAVRGLQLRGGPSSQYPVVSTLEASQQLDIIGISEDGNWYQVMLPDSSPAWVSSSPAMVTTFGNTFNVPLAEPPTNTPTETPTITPTEAATNTPTETATNTASPTEAATNTPTATATTEQGVAISITMGSTVQGTIEGQLSDNRYSFFGEAGTIVDIRMNNVSGNLDPLLILLDPNGQEIARNDDDPNGLNRDSYIQGFTLPVSGVYTIVATRFQEAQGVSEGTFSLTLSEGAGTTPVSGPSQTVEGTIQGTTNEVRFTFDGQAGDVVDILMIRTSGELDPLLILYGVNGQEIARDDDSGGELNARISSVTLPTSGTYTIAATRFAFLNSEGTFSLTLTLVNGTGPAPQLVPVGAAPTNAIEYGQSVEGTIQANTTEVRYTFTAEAGDVVDIHMNQTGGSLDPLLILFGPNGQEIARDDDGGGSRNAYIRSVTVPENGTYTIVASRFGTSEGDFSLTLTLVSENETTGPSDGNIITYGQTVQGSLDAATPEIRYTFTAQAGEVIDIRMNRSGSQLDPLLILLGPNGQEISRDDDGGGSRNAYIRNLTLSAGGTYTIVASSFGGSQGDFSLTLTRVSGGSVGATATPGAGGSNTINYGQTVQGTVPAQANGEVRYTFTAQAGDVIEIRMNRTAGGSLDPLLILLGPNGQEVARDDDGGGSRNAYIRNFTIPANGTYTIVATQFGTAGGNFNLTLTR